MLRRVLGASQGNATDQSLPLLDAPGAVVFPNSVVNLVAFDVQLGGHRECVLLPNKKRLLPPSDHTRQVGTLLHVIGSPIYLNSSCSVLRVQGVARVEVTPVRGRRALCADVAVINEDNAAVGVRDRAELRNLVFQLGKLDARLCPLVIQLFGSQPLVVVDALVSSLGAKFEDQQSVLRTVDARERMQVGLKVLRAHVQGLFAEMQVALHTTEAMAKRRREQVLRRQTAGLDTVGQLKKRLEQSDMPPYARKVAEEELKRAEALKSTPSASLSVHVNYLTCLLDLPWHVVPSSQLSLHQATALLQSSHTGMEAANQRVLEFLAVEQLNKNRSTPSPILCFVGPPGVGKTSLGAVIGKVLGRKLARVALGGVHDESEIRGHRKTYVAAMPGRVIQAIQRCGACNPVMLLDEIDKTGVRGNHGDVSSALLEVLDPEQNHAFSDHYLDIPYDLSKCVFIATANDPSTIPKPLLDRMEIIRFSGYTPLEKLTIARNHLIPQQVETHGLPPNALDFRDCGLDALVRGYTREAGVRELKRKIASVCRHAALQAQKKGGKAVEAKEVANEGLEQKAQEEQRERGEAAKEEQNEGKSDQAGQAGEANAVAHFATPLVVDAAKVEEILGPRLFHDSLSQRVSTPGVAVGLAWTAMGGDILCVEACVLRGKGDLILTGQLGDVIKESAKIAYSWVRRHLHATHQAPSLAALSLAPAQPSAPLVRVHPHTIDGAHAEEAEWYRKLDIHIHFPEGAVPKDGPSAGVTLVTALMSLLTNRTMRDDTAMTGEVTLNGAVLPVGGIKEKVIAAHTARLKRVILPAANKPHAATIPAHVLESITLVYATHVTQVLDAAFSDKLPAQSKL